MASRRIEKFPRWRGTARRHVPLNAAICIFCNLPHAACADSEPLETRLLPSSIRAALRRRLSCLLLALLLPAIAAAGDDPYAGLVANQTVTVAGQEFCAWFMTFWRDQDISDRYALSVHERPSARWGSQVWIVLGQRRIFQATLPPSRAALKAVGEQAAEAAYRNVVEAEAQRLLFSDADIGRDEL
jgi:curli production assembly/transport component CsgE